MPAITQFEVEFGVAEEEPDGPFQGFIQRNCQPLGHYVVGLQHPGTDRAHPEGTPVNIDLDYLNVPNHCLLAKYSLAFKPV